MAHILSTISGRILIRPRREKPIDVMQAGLRGRLTLYHGGLLAAVALVVLLTALLSAERLSMWTLVLSGAAFGGATSLGILGAYQVTARALRPLQDITAAVRRASTATLEQRLNYVGPRDELAELAEAFDAMLDRLALTFASQKRFVANASHELRTPLAVMSTEIDVTLADPKASAAELRRMADVVRGASQRANQLVESLLLLARTEARAGREFTVTGPVDLSDGARAGLRAVDERVRELNLQVATQLAAATVNGDATLLDRLAGNLIENAVRYNVAYGHVWVRTYATAESAYLQVANTGPELEAEDVPDLFEPFRRGSDRTGTRGSGLGLSIVQAVVTAHGGQVRARPRADGGLEITAILPVSVPRYGPAAELDAAASEAPVTLDPR